MGGINRRHEGKRPHNTCYLVLFEVIYDRRYGSVQFTLAYNGRINNTPTGECILAAKCALAGVVVAKDCLFYQAEKLTGSWMDKNREVAICVGGNKFFY